MPSPELALTCAMSETHEIRLATAADLAAISRLIDASVRGLSVGYYTDAQIEQSLRHVFGPDSQLIADGTYYVIESPAGDIVAAGGWSKRRTLYGGDQHKGAATDPLLDPATDAARIRALFVHPGWARRGLGRRIFEHCRAAAEAAGFTTLELGATLPGVPLYAALGFGVVEEIAVEMEGGEKLAVVRMRRAVGGG
ncbi:MAG: N-acetyltransferase [Gemmatimonadetes bacterium]|nr:N-acetyltransferase [Gemmatimonadota bacterium]